MKTLAIVGLSLCVGFVAIFILYAVTTKRIIDSQEREIARLRTQLKREKQKARKEKEKQTMQLKNVPEFDF